MENGRYGRANTDFKKLTINKFPLCLFDYAQYGSTGCGANALSLLTGVNPRSILRMNEGRSHYGDKFMLAFLRKKGIRAFKLTKCNITGRTGDGDFLSGLLSPNNLLLASQLIKKQEASWFVYWNNIQYHNFELGLATFSSLLNFPIVSAYVLYNQAWAK